MTTNLNLPYGAQIGGSLILPMSTGKVLYVGSTVASARNAANQGLTPEYPLATIDYAIGLCTASVGDIIYVLPGHAETIAAAGGIAVDKAGISIIGLGNGANRPTITWSATDSTMTISAANVLLKNLITTVSIDEVVSMISVTGANVTLDGVDFVPYGALGVTGQAVQWLLTTNAADQLTIKNCVHRQQTATTADTVWIQLVGPDNVRIIDNFINITAKAGTGSICIHGSTAPPNIEIARNTIMFLGATLTKVVDIAAAVGIINDNRIAVTSTATTIDSILTASAAHKFQNYAIDVGGTASGLLTPAVGTYT
jgi:hypothetical protein